MLQMAKYIFSWLLSIITNELYVWKFGSIFFTMIFVLYKLLKFKTWKKPLGSIGYEHLLANLREGETIAKIMAKTRRKRDVGKVPPVYPNGWFPLLDSYELPKGQIRNVYALGEHFAIFRGENGKVSIVDAEYLHMEVNVANGDVFKEASLKRWLSYEVNTIIYVWYHSENEMPSWYPKIIDVIQDGTFSYRGRAEYFVNTHVQDIFENAADITHFSVVHGSLSRNRWLAPLAKTEFFNNWYSQNEDGKRHIANMDTKYKLKILNHVIFQGSGSSIYEGPSTIISRCHSKFGEFVILETHVPVEPLVVKMEFKAFYPITSLLFGFMTFLQTCFIAECDIPIWNHKRYADNPLIIKEDEALKRFRRWFNQFYSENSPKFRGNNLEC